MNPSRTAISSPWPIALLGWIGATKATGAALATIALVDAARALDMSGPGRTAAASVGALSIAATVIASGLLADRIGRRTVLMGSFVVSGAGSLVTALAPGLIAYLAGSILAGVGFGAMFAGAFAYVRTVAPGSGLGWGLGLFSTYCTLVAALASISGGLLASVSWRALFLVVPVMCLVSLVATPRLLPPVPAVGGGPVDVLGLVLLGFGLVLLLVGLSRATLSGGLSAWGPALAGLLVLAIWAWWEARTPHAAFPIRLFASRAFVVAAFVGMTFNMVQAAGSLQLSDYWQFVDGQTPLVVSVEVQPIYVLGIVGALVAGRRLSAGSSTGTLLVVSCLLTAVGFLALVPLSQSAGYAWFLPGVGLIGVGMMAGTTVQSKLFVDQASDTSYGTVTASRSTVGQIGFAFGFALSTVIIQRLTDDGVIARMVAIGQSPPEAEQSWGAVAAYARTGAVPGLATAQEALTAGAASFHQAMQILMASCALLMVISAAVALVLLRPSRGA